MDLASPADPEGRVVFVLTEYYQTKAGLEQYWEDSLDGGVHILSAMKGVLAIEGAIAEFYQPLFVKGSINWH